MGEQWCAFIAQKNEDILLLGMRRGGRIQAILRVGREESSQSCQAHARDVGIAIMAGSVWTHSASKGLKGMFSRFRQFEQG